ncbi:MAG: DUF4255 domain-containing protein [Octadecabacter sp.]|nr:DUF4255 domain-containing protein [Octadecabacter sp.]
MIDLALNLVCSRLNSHLSAIYSVQEDLVVLAPLSDSEGRPTAKTHNRLALFMTNLTEDTVSRAKPKSARGPLGGRRPMHLDVYFMLASGHDPKGYSEGLKLISTALMFFQANAVMTPERFPEMPTGLSNLTFEIANLRTEEVSQMWGALERRYVPSVMFKMRSVIIDAGAVSHITPLIRTPEDTTRPRQDV